MVHFFDSDIAKKYGVNAAVLTAFLWDSVEQKSTESPQLHEGKVWVRCSVQIMTGFFPFLSYDEIRYALRNNYCRCTGYVKIMDAVRLAAKILKKGEMVRIYRVRAISYGRK